MVEPIMYFAIGFLISTLLGLAIVPLVHNRAVRLTTRRLEAATPLSMAEIQADKDQLRAEFAMSARRLEMSVDQLKAKTTTQLAELGKKSDAINRMKFELGEKNATIFQLEAREKARQGTVARDRRRVRDQNPGAARGRADAVRQAEGAGEARPRAVRPLATRRYAAGRACRRQHPDHRPATARQRCRARVHRGAAEAFIDPR